jgi:hypothetical protein
MRSAIRCVAIVFLFTLLSCSAEPETIEVTRVVTETEEVEVTRLVEVEVTRLVEVQVTRPVEVEVTRPVEVTRIVLSDATPTIESSGREGQEEVDPSTAFAANYVGTLEQSEITVEIARILFMHRDALKPELSFEGHEPLANDEYVAEVMWRITNGTDRTIRWWTGDINVRVNGRQISLGDLIFSAFGESPVSEIFPGSTIVGGLWYGVGTIAPDEVTSFSLLLGKPFDPNTYTDLAGNFIIDVDLSGEHSWVEIPDELR